MTPRPALTLLPLALLASLLTFPSGVLAPTPRPSPPTNSLKTRAVVLIVLDGLRWQEVFDGPEHDLMDEKHGGVEDLPALRKEFWRDTPAAGRAAVLPFLWNVVAKQGEIFGNQHRGSIARVTNGYKFSYPGYNEMLSGHADPRINSNSFGPNPNETVFEYLNKQQDLRGQVAAFTTWDNFVDIFNVPRSGLLVRAGWRVSWTPPLTPREELLRDLYAATTHIDSDGVLDSFMQLDLMDYLESHSPRVLFVGYGETDDWAHNGRYDLVLESAHNDDAGIAALWNHMQQNSAYRDQVTFIITADHGRGDGLENWKHHGEKIAGAENIWVAVIGPDTPPLGELANVPPVTQSQIAATIAALLGYDYRREVPAAAPPLPIAPAWTDTRLGKASQ
jgi:hypothetical protein